MYSLSIAFTSLMSQIAYTTAREWAAAAELHLLYTRASTHLLYWRITSLLPWL